MCLLLFACGDEKHLQKLHNYIVTLKEKVASQKTVTAINVQFPKPFIYKAESLREPFKGTEAIKGDIIVNPLRAYPINMLRFVGTLSKDDRLFAYILAPDNKLYQVTVGERIGDRNGKVSAILPNRLEVIEQDFDSGKSLGQRKVILQLKDVKG